MPAAKPLEPADELSRLRTREAQLRSRIDELEVQLSSYRSTRDTFRGERLERIREESSRTTDEASKLVRGVALALLETLRTAADAASALVDGVYERNRPEVASSVTDLATRLPRDMADGLLDAFDRVADIPNRVVDTLHSSYRESEQKRNQGQVRSVQPLVQRTEREEDHIKQALGRPVTRVILDPQDEVILNVGQIITNQAIARARLSGVLDMLLDSVYEGEPVFTVEELRAQTTKPNAEAVPGGDGEAS